MAVLQMKQKQNCNFFSSKYFTALLFVSVVAFYLGYSWRAAEDILTSCTIGGSIETTTPSLSEIFWDPKKMTDNDDDNHVDYHQPVCTKEQRTFQIEAGCQYYGGRHNLKAIFPLLRQFIPQATVLIDVGANKGLVSARFFELWRPQIGVPLPKEYAQQVVKRYWQMHRITKMGNECGVTYMCDKVNQTEINYLQSVAPIPLQYDNDDPFIVHSFDPSPNINIHLDYLQNYTNDNPKIAKHWKWHRIAASDKDEQVYFDQRWDEGGSINTQTKQLPNTRAAKLDTLAFQDKLFGPITNDFMIDVLKIDAESVDAQVLAGAGRLMQQNRIRVVMWETPNNFPLTVHLGGASSTSGPLKGSSNSITDNDENIIVVVNGFTQFIELLDQTFGMTCYFPGTDQRMIRLTSCETETLRTTLCKNSPHCPFPNGCKVEQSNALCVHRRQAEALYKHLESQSVSAMMM